MTIICDKRWLAVGEVRPELDNYIKGLRSTGHFGSSDIGVFIATLGSVEIPPEIQKIIDGKR